MHMRALGFLLPLVEADTGITKVSGLKQGSEAQQKGSQAVMKQAL